MSEPYLAERVTDGETMAKVITDFVNLMNHDGNGFAEAMQRQHRTLQQSTMGLFMLMVQKFAELANNGYYDLRNEAAVKLAQRILNEIPEDDRYLPFV